MASHDPSNGPGSSASADETSFHVRRAREGDAESSGWLVTRLSPLLLMQADYRLPKGLRSLCSPEDVVQQVWLVTLPRLSDLRARGGHWTPVLLKFLGTTLLNTVNNLITRHLRGPRRVVPAAAESSGSLDPLDRLAASVTDALQRLQRSERARLVHEAIAALEPHEQEVVILRGIEQLPNREVGRVLGLEPSAVTMRYQRALRRLRDRLPGSVFDELPTP